MNQIRNARFSALIAGVCSATLVVPLFAQELEEIIVVARKREESLQEVPLSISTFSEEDLAVQGIESLEDIARQSAGIIFDKGFSPQDTRVVMRGLSPTRGRPNVAVLLDDVDISSEAISTAGSSLLVNPRLIDVERIEVVRGPQAALYGRSAFAGAIHYVTRRPGQERRGQMSVDVSAEGKREFTGGFSGPLTDNFALGFNFAAWNEDGHYDNPITGGELGGQQGVGVSMTAALDASESARVTARFEYSDDEFAPSPVAAYDERTVLGTPASALGTVIHPDATGVEQPFGTIPLISEVQLMDTPDAQTGEDYSGTTREILRGHIRAEFDFAGATLTSITHFAQADTTQHHDTQHVGDISAPVPPFGTSTAGKVRFATQTDLFSQEFRLSSTGEGPFSWVLGGLLWNEDTHRDGHSLTCLNYGFLPPFFVNGRPDFTKPIDCGYWFARIGTVVPDNNRPWDREISHYSTYGLLEWQFSEAWDLGLEALYVSEELDLTGPTTGSTIGNAFGPFTEYPAAPDLIPAEEDDSYLAPKLILRYRPSDEQTYYGSISRGVKPGGISTLTGGAAEFDPDLLRFEAEEITVYEFGWKTSWMENRLRFNGAIFYQDFSDKQLTTQFVFPGGRLGTRPENASSAKIAGIEIDTAAVLTDNLSMRWAYTWLSSEYDEYNKLSTSLNDAARGGNCTVTTLGASPICLVDLSGRDVEDIPRHSVFAGISWRSEMANGGEWMVDLDVQYQGSRWETEWNLLRFESYVLADLRVGVSRGPWTVIAYVENLLNDDTIKTGFSAPDLDAIRVISGFVPPPRVPPPGRFFFTLAFPNAVSLYLPEPRIVGVRASYSF